MNYLEKLRTAFGIGIIIFVIMLCLGSCVAQISLINEPEVKEEPAQSNTQLRTAAEKAEKEPVRYMLTDEERSLVEQVVMAESGGEPYCGQVAVAQCILNAAEKDGIRPSEVFGEYQYTPNRKDPSESVQRAVSAVFDRGEVATDETILWFYAPKYVDGTPWHETQRHVLTINNHKFFAEWRDADADH